MKFKNIDDKKMFLLEMSKIDMISQVCEEWEPTTELIELFIGKRGELTKSIKDFRRSQATKSQWRQHRHKIMRGIKNFHRSTKGKQFHRSLGRFIATRFTGQSIFQKDPPERESDEALSVFDSLDTLKAISSLRTHIYIESEYFMPFSEYVEFLELSDELLESSFMVEKKLLRYDLVVDEKELDILARVITPAVMIDCLLQRTPGKVKPEDFDRVVEVYEDKLNSGLSVFEALQEATQ